MNASLFFKKFFRTPAAMGIITIFLFTTNALAAGGTLDSTFGTNGITIADLGSNFDTGTSVVLQSDGKFLLVGSAQLNPDKPYEQTTSITRFNSNGTVDNSFGSNGRITPKTDTFSGSKVAIQSNGKLIVAGLNQGSFAVARYNNDGALDTSFGVNGVGSLDPNNGDTSQHIADVAIQSDDRIVVVGDYTLRVSNHIDFYVVRFTSNGLPDETFVNRLLDWSDFFASRYNYGKAVTIQPDGKIILSGDMLKDDDGKKHISLARLNPNGSLDKSTFGSGGLGTTSAALLPNFKHSNGAIALQTDGKIIVAGTIFNNADDAPENLAVVRFNSNSTLDNTFGGTGIVITDFGAKESGSDVHLQADGKIIIVGTSSTGSSSSLLILRYNSDGSLDNTFGDNGKLINDFGNGTTAGAGAEIQTDGKLVVAGSSSGNAILARYDTGASNTVQTSLTYKSVDAYDGWILESAENSNKGGTFDRTAVINVGDDGKDRQYRGILSFNTISIPDDVLITSAQLKIKRQGFVGTDAFTTHGDLLLDVRNGTFSNNIALKVEDFSAITDAGSNQEKFSESTLNWYTANLSNTNLGFINRYGVTQFRILFSKDDNDDMGADYVKFYSGSAASSNQPQLIITYSTSSSGTGNNHAPVITSNGGGTTASVNVSENAIAVTTVTAKDADVPAQAITYSISGGSDAGKFSIKSNTGALAFVTAPDFEAMSPGTIYHVIIQASDGSLGTSQDIAVTVTGVNEYAPQITSNGGGTTASISLPENTIAVTTVTANDADLPTPTLTYSIIGGIDAALFSLNPSDGKLSFVTAPSYNVPNDAGLDHVYNVTVQASDGTFANPQEFIITIINPNPSVGMTTLHQFGGQANNGRVPYGVLVMSDGFLYGTTTYGGAPYNVPPTNPANKGNLFKMNMDGTGFTVLHEFAGGANDGWKPWSGLAIAGGTIYGSTVYGGPRGEGGGVIYEMDINGGGFRVLHAFGEAGDGFGGSTSPTLVGDTLYGLTRWGGNGSGTIYSYNTTSEAYTQLHRFAVNSSDGNAPLGTLTATNDGFLYGLTWLGGKNNLGTLFRIKPNGSAFETVYHFVGGAQGKYPYDSLVFDGSHILYGTTLGEYGNNTADLGTLFKYDLTSKTYTVLHKFAGGSNDSGKPNGSLVLSSDGVTLFGSTHGDDAWGGKEFGILYQMNVDGTGFKQLYEFKGGMAGATPMRTPLLIDGILYGMTAYGGTENYGLIYRFQAANSASSQRSFAALSINTYSPIITSSNAISVSENNIVVTTVTVTDADVPTQPLTYSIIGGADSSIFSINPSTGELVFSAAPNYETPTDSGLDNIYNITMQASDGVVAVTQDIVVTVTSVNENSPVITSNSAISIPENTTAVTLFSATDADLPAQPLTYSIIGGADAPLFTVNSATGELNFITAPDFEIPTDAGSDHIYNATLQVSDGELVNTQDIVVTVNAVNENTPAITSVGNLSILENNTAVTTVSATDADLPAQPLAYSIVGGVDSALFTINSSTGELTFITTPDYETPTDVGLDNIYNVTVQVSDGILATAQDIAVTVTAVNDNTPKITSISNPSIPENSTAVITVTAADADLPTQFLIYSIVGGPDSAFFSINSSTGELTFISTPDYETPKDTGLDNIYNITAQVSDGALVISQDITVTLIAVDEYAPKITSVGNFAILENATAVTTITATDADLPAQTLAYSILNGADAALFTINSSTGELTFITAPDYEMPKDIGLDNIYNVTVQVFDETLNITQDIAVSIVAVNDNSPMITSPNSFSIPENTNSAAAISATDADRPAQALTYSVVGGLDALKFYIVSATGELKFITAPDFDIPGDFNLDNVYEVAVQSSDGTRNSTQNISIHITNTDK